MFNIANLLESLEKLIFEVLMWVIFVPKTLIKVIWDPDWVAPYVDEELAKKEGRFANYMSPLLLVVLITTGLYGLYENIWQAELVITGPETAKVGELTTLYARPQYWWQGSTLGEVWIVRNATLQTEYRLIRYDPTTGQLDTEKFLGEFAQGGDSTKTVEVREESLESPSQFVYTWETPGIYRIIAIFINSAGDGSVNQSGYEIVVIQDGQPPPQSLPSPDEPPLSVFESRERAFSVALIGMVIPVWLSLAGELVKRKPLTRAGLQRSLYIHSLYMAPVALASLLILLGIRFYVPSLALDFIKAETHISRTAGVLLEGITIFMLVWYFVVEVRFFQREFARPYWLAGLFTAGMLYVPYWIYEDRLDLFRDEQIFWFGLYLIPVGLLAASLILFKVFPFVWALLKKGWMKLKRKGIVQK